MLFRSGPEARTSGVQYIQLIGGGEWEVEPGTITNETEEVGGELFFQ